MLEHEGWGEEPRKLSEIVDASEEFYEKIWYDRHKSGLERLKNDAKSHPDRYGDILNRAQKAAQRIEKKYGKDNVGPWTDFQWGMLNGKLSALRWVLGDEWDMLDT